MTKKPRISLRGLRTFCVAARHGSLRAAGEELFVTASAVSHQVKSLEGELGELLFERGSRSLELTQTGRSLYDEISPLIEQLEDVVGRHQKRGRRRSVRISVQPFFASELFVPRLAEFAADHPDIDIQVNSSDESSEKLPASGSLSIRLFRSPPSDLTSDELFPLRMVPAGSPEFAEALEVKKKAIVSEFPIIVHETHSQAWRQWSKESGIRLPDTPRVVRLDTMIAAVRAAEQGVGAALVPTPHADRWFASGSLVKLFKQELVADASYYLVCRESKTGGADLQALRAWILATFAQDG